MNTHVKAGIGLLIIALLLSSPASGLAKGDDSKGKDRDQKTHSIERKDSVSKKDDDKKSGDNRDHKKDHKGPNTKTCLRAWGHIFAPGWLKKNGSITPDGDCRLPFGIGKRFHGYNASTTPDTTAPIIRMISLKPAKTQVEISWATDEKSDSTVFWSLTSPVDISASTTKSVTQNTFTKEHTIMIKDLAVRTTYYIVVRSRDAAGNTTTSDTQSFTTTATSSDTSAPVISNVATLIGTSTVEVGWINNESTSGRVFYSTTLPVALSGSGALFVNSASTTKNHSVTLSTLNPNTTYYVVIESTDLAGNVSTSATFSAKTSDYVTPDTTAPVISAVSTVAGTSTTQVTWNTNELSNSYIFYATSTPVTIGSASTYVVSSGTLVNNHSFTLTNLATSTRYYVIIRSTDTANNTATSSEFSFLTGSGL
jgi:hypothetical protein